MYGATCKLYCRYFAMAKIVSCISKFLQQILVFSTPITNSGCGFRYSLHRKTTPTSSILRTMTVTRTQNLIISGNLATKSNMLVAKCEICQGLLRLNRFLRFLFITLNPRPVWTASNSWNVWAFNTFIVFIVDNLGIIKSLIDQNKSRQ